MEPKEFENTPEFQRFKKGMRGILAVPKKRLDELVQAAKEESPRKGDPNAPGRKRTLIRKQGIRKGNRS
jgi:hypothetical protein